MKDKKNESDVEQNKFKRGKLFSGSLYQWVCRPTFLGGGGINKGMLLRIGSHYQPQKVGIFPICHVEVFVVQITQKTCIYR